MRGARNYPCQEFPGKRAPTVQLCRDPRGYVPIGNNPWRGPPVPYGHPGHQRPRNITAAQQVPEHSARADYDPGPPVVQLPPGVPPGPGPAPNAPFPLPVPPNDNGPPPPLPLLRAAGPDRAAVRQDATRTRHRHRPRRRRRLHRRPSCRPGAGGPLLPAEAQCRRRPAARAAATYDSRTGVFADPAGGTGVFAAGMDKVDTAETWVDLMLDPRQA